MSRSPTRLGSPAFGWIASRRLPAAGTICSSTPYKVLEPTEQFAPRAWTPSARNVRPTSAGERPVNVTPSSVKAICATMGRSVTERIASIASAISARSENVSTMHASRSEEHTSELQSRLHLVCRLLLEKKKQGDGLISVYYTAKTEASAE